MIRTAARIFVIFLTYVIVFVLLKPLFLALYAPEGASLSDWIDVIIHGLPMDCSMSGYLTIFPALLTIVSIWSKSKIVSILFKSYIALTAFLISAVAVIDLTLYDYWHFRLDATPIFYFLSSPSSALASASIFTSIAGFIAILFLSVVIFYLINFLSDLVKIDYKYPIGSTIAGVIFTAALIIPIRGSFTVSTMNISRAYYSDNQRLNHAAINPAFSLMYSLTHQSDFSSQFRFFDSDRLAQILSDIAGFDVPDSPESPESFISTDNPDIYIIILESFSNHLLPSLGGEAVATGLDSIARSGLTFSNFFASGARTDRAIPAILGGFPAQPTTSLMKFTRKIENTPSLSKAIKEAGHDYKLTYYYGGDANFTNMLAYLRNAAFDKVVSDKDFSPEEKRSKWGAHDDVLFRRVIEDLNKTDNSPQLRVIQTSSSHEPFEVPYSNRSFADNPRKNAFAFADSCVTDFVENLSRSNKWDNSIVIITADHYGAYPQDLENPLERHSIPMIITGGALKQEPRFIETIGDQTDIAATLLQGLGINHGQFDFSHDLFNPHSPHYAFFTEPGIAAFVCESDTSVINLDANSPLIRTSASAADKCRALLQKLYDKLSEL